MKIIQGVIRDTATALSSRKITNVDVELSSYSYRSDDTFFYKFDNDAWWSALRKGPEPYSAGKPPWRQV